MRTNQHAFTLIEILVVIAITAILMGLLLAPLIQGFIMTRRSQSFVEAQNAAREAVQRLTAEISNAVYVFDNSSDAACVNIWMRQRNGQMVPVPIRFSKIDLILAKQTGQVADPTVNKPLGPLALPLAPGLTIVRYFVGLRDNSSDNNGIPTLGYANSYEDLTSQAETADNMYVLYRAEVRVTNSDGSINTDLFDTDPNNSRLPVLNDPNFFYKNAVRAANWKKASTIINMFNDTDLLEIAREKTGRKNIIWADDGDGNANNDIPLFKLLVSFAPQDARQEPAYAESDQNKGVEVINLTPSFRASLDPNTFQHVMANESTGVASTRFYTAFGGWGSKPTVTCYRTPPDAQDVVCFTTKWENNPGDPSGLYPDMCIYRQVYHNGALTNETRVFNISAYDANKKSNAGPTFVSVNANTRDALVANANDKDVMPFYVDMNKGIIDTAFPHDVLETASTKGSVLFPVGRMQMMLSPENTLDPESINGIYREMYRSFRDAYGRTVIDPHRFAYLKFNGSPLERFTGSTIVPGSEVIYGPDQNPGPHFGQRVRYTRIPNNIGGMPGPNQYIINYLPREVPQNILTRLNDMCDYLASEPNNPYAPSLSNLKKMIQDYYMLRFDVGYVMFCSDPELPLANSGAMTDIEISYMFQVNRPNDTFVVDYSTSEVISIMVGIRRFDSMSNQPQTVILSAKAKARNFLRD